MSVNQDLLDNKLWKLQQACNQYKQVDPLSDWVLFAVSRYINTGKATRNFELDFVNYPDDKLEELIKKCLNGDRSDNGIIRTMRNIICR